MRADATESGADLKMPGRFRRWFWDIEFTGDELRTHPFFAVERVLQHADWSDIRWLRERIGNEFVSEVIRKSRRVSRRTATLWALLLDIPHEDIACFREPSLIPLTGS